MIGPSYQASVPGGLSSYGDTLPYGNLIYICSITRSYLGKIHPCLIYIYNPLITENEDKLLWNPYLLPEEASEEYLAKSQENIQGGNGVSSLPLGAHIRDDEQVIMKRSNNIKIIYLFTNLFWCNFP